MDEQTETEKPLLSRKVSMTSPVVIRKNKNANKSPRPGRGGNRGGQMIEEVFPEELAGDFLVCDGYKCDLPPCPNQPTSNIDGTHQHQSSDTKDPPEPEKQSEALSTLSRHPTTRASLAVRNRKGTESGPHPTQDEEQSGRLSGQQVQLHAGQAGTCPDRNPKDDISKCDDQNYVSDQVTRQSDNPKKADETDRKEASGGLPQVLSWPESLDGHLSQLDELCSPQSSTRSKKVDEKKAEPNDNNSPNTAEKHNGCYNGNEATFPETGI